jgi:glutamine synthetase
MSKLAYQFLGGIMHTADSMAAVFNPTINSYKRIDATVTLSGATWSPNAISYSGNNRTHMIRIPDEGRFELRLMDGAANPYLMQAGALVMGLDGIENKRDPGPRLDVNMYEEGARMKRIKRLPLNMLDAIRLFDKNKVIRAGFGDALVDSYVKLKLQEWKSYSTTLSQWERDNTLDC